MDKPQKKMRFSRTKAPLRIQTTTLWEYPSQHYGNKQQGDKDYIGATPSYVIWNLLQRYTRENDLVIDPMCGSGTTLDVARDLKRKARGFDIAPYRPDIEKADARQIPLADQTADFVFVDPPYSTHVKYSGDPQCIGELDAFQPEYYKALDLALAEMHRILKPKRYLGLYVSDSFKKSKGFEPIGFELFQRMRQLFRPVDIICVTRGNRTLKRGNWHKAAEEGNFYLRGFNYLFIMKKDMSK